VAVASRIPFAITHEPGHMFVTDLRHDALAAGPNLDGGLA